MPLAFGREQLLGFTCPVPVSIKSEANALGLHYIEALHPIVG